jgi:magnesium chelatase subunit D
VTSLARFPFSAVVGQDEARLALLLAAIDPGIGGVLLRGDKGSAKSTLARGLAGMLPGGAPFVELPLGATEDRVLGTLDLKAALADGATQFRPGLLAAAHGGVLYVDEVNLLPDHLVDVLLDVAGSGVNRVERDGVSHSHPARFVLVGSMNPEEGELRPQLLDRFGLSVEIKAPGDPLKRAEVVRRRLTHDAGGVVGGSEGDIVLRARLAAAMPADLPDTVVEFACRLAVSVSAEGLRADLVLCRAAAAFAGWEGRSVATSSDVERVASVALGHRRRRRPFDPPILSTADLERALDAARQSFADASRPPAPPPETDVPKADVPATAASEGAGTDDASSADAAGEDAASEHAASEDEASELADAVDDRVASGEPAPGPETAAGSDIGDRGETVEDAADGAAGGESTGDDPASGGHERGPVGGGEGTASPSGDAGGETFSAEPTAPTGTWQTLAGPSLDAPPQPTHLADSPSPPGPAAPSSPSASIAGSARFGRPLSSGPDSRGRMIGDQPAGSGAGNGVALAATVRSAAQRRQADPDGPTMTVDDLREPVRSRTVGRTVVIAVDASGSMGTHRRVAAATGAVLGLLADAYLRRDRLAMVTFRGDAAEVVLPPTASVELARARLAELPTGGVTPLAEGIDAALAIARRAASDGWSPLLVLITDGRATGQQAALDRAMAAAAEVAAANLDVVVIDAEDGSTRLGLAEQLATTMGARYLRLDELSSAQVEAAVREALPR